MTSAVGSVDDPRARADLGAGALDLGHLVGGHLAGVPPRDDAVGAEPAGPPPGLEDGDGDPPPPQLGRTGEARGPRPDDGDTARALGSRDDERPAGVAIGVDREPLEGSDRHRAVQARAHARALAQVLDRADARARPAEWVGGEDRAGGTVRVAGGDGPDEAGHVDAGGAAPPRRARRSSRGSGHELVEAAVAGDEAVAPRREGGGDRTGVGEVGEHEHAGLGAGRTDGRDHRGTVAVGQGPVDDDHVRREGGHGGSRLGDAVGRTDGLDARLCGEHVDEAVGNHALAVDHQNLHGAENS